MHHYEWMELKDFSAGMWTVNDWQIPINGAALLEDCYPLPNGGLRAAGLFSSLTNSGIAVDEVPLALWVEDHATGDVGESDYYLITKNAANTAQKLYRMDQTAGATSWTLLQTFTGTENDAQPYFVSYQLLGQTDPYIYFTISNIGADQGIWRVVPSTGVVSRPTIVTTDVAVTELTGPIAVHQDRLVISEEFHKIWFTNPGTETIDDLNVIEVAPSNRLNTITFMRPFAPSDLLVATRGAPWTMVQDELTDPLIRAMGDVRHSLIHQIPTEMDEGIAFQAVHDGIYATPDGARFEKLSEPISAEDLWTSAPQNAGALAYLNNWLFTPGGMIFDTRTRAWFRTSAWDTSPNARAMVVNKHRNSHTVVIARQGDEGDPPLLYTLTPREGHMDRVTDYRYISPPFHHPEARQMEFGEINVICKSFSAAASIEYIVNGTTREVENIGTGRQAVQALFRERGEQLDLELRVHSNHATAEAPSIEAIRIGTMSGHLLRTV